MPLSGAAEVRAAVSAARDALGGWSATPFQVRGSRSRSRRSPHDGARRHLVGFGAAGQRCLAVGPLISAAARERIRDAIATARAAGDAFHLGGGGGPDPFIGPTVIEPAEAESRLAREELFGPLLAVVRQPDLDRALEWSNRSRYGNATAIFTTSGRAAREFRARIESGMLGVNISVPAPIAWFPFAGWKDSIAGDLHANGDDAVEFYTRKKVLTSRW